MSIHPATLALAVPVATKVSSAVAEAVGRTIPFKQLFAGESSAESTPSRDSPSLAQQLDSLSQSLRQWLAEHGINTPYEISIGSISSDSSDQLSVHGIQGQEIRSLLNKDKERLSALRNLAASVQYLSSSLGAGKSGLIISDNESDIIY